MSHAPISRPHPEGLRDSEGDLLYQYLVACPRCGRARWEGSTNVSPGCPGGCPPREPTRFNQEELWGIATLGILLLMFIAVMIFVL
jgi:hypothetical protein